ncbi:MAG: CHAT domain-containing protein, partial [Spirulina sp.]
SFPEQLELLVVTPEDQIIYRVVPEASATRLQETMADFRQTVTNSRRPTTYLASSQQLYDWLIAPIASELEGLEVDTLVFSLDAGLRTLPLAALHDGEQFLVEKYSLGVIPSVSLTNTRYRALQDPQVLAIRSPARIGLETRIPHRITGIKCLSHGIGGFRCRIGICRVSGEYGG